MLLCLKCAFWVFKFFCFTPWVMDLILRLFPYPKPTPHTQHHTSQEKYHNEATLYPKYPLFFKTISLLRPLLLEALRHQKTCMKDACCCMIFLPLTYPTLFISAICALKKGSVSRFPSANPRVLKEWTNWAA